MTKNNTFNEVATIISEVLEIDKSKIKENSNLFTDLDVESLDLVDLLRAFEEKYQIEIPDQDIKSFQTVKDIVDYLNQHNA